MSGAECPSCGIAVVPGYVRCPKCHKPLPRRPAPVVGGTALPPTRRFPVLAIAGAVFVAAAIIAYFGLRDSAPPAQRPPEAPPPAAEVEQPPAAAPTAEAPAEPQTTGPNAQQVAAQLERALKRQRLWSTVRVIGNGVDVQSGSCEDPAMAAALDSAAPALKAAGLTEVRCLEQSGRVVTTRDL